MANVVARSRPVVEEMFECGAIVMAPVLLGGGIPLFADLGDRLPELECTRVIESDGVTHLRYQVREA